MPTYEIRAPNGKTYRIDGPEGATQEQIQQEVMRQFPDSAEGLDMSSAPITDDSPIDQLAEYAPDIATTMFKGAAKAVTGPIDLAMETGGLVSNAINTGLSEGGAALLDLVGAEGAASGLRDAGERSRAGTTQRTNDLQFRNALDQVIPTPKGFELSEMGAELVAGAAIPFKTARGGPRAPQANPRVNSKAAEIVAEGQRRNVPVMTTDVKPPRSAPGRFFKQTVPEKIPLAGTSGPRLAQQEARQRAVADIVEEFGGDTGRALFDDSDTISQQIAKDFAKQRSARLTKLTTAKNSVINSIDEPFAEAPRTVRAIDEQIEKLRGIDADEFAPVIERLDRFKANLTSGKTLDQIEGQRRLLGDLFADNNLASIRGDGEKAIRAIYAPLREDMGSFIEATAGRAARAKWARANEELSAMAGELTSTTFRNVLKQADTTPETISRILFSNAENTSDLRRLVENLDEAGVRKVQGALLTRAFERAGGADGVSVEKFLGNLNQLSGKIGVAFKGEDRASLEGLRRLLEATRRGAEAGANIRTGEQNVPTILGIGATQALGFMGGVGTLGVGGLVARLYESAPVRNLLIGLSKSSAGSTREAKTIQRIMKASVPIINNWRDDIARVANDNPGFAAAAEEPSE